jgi:hypothetical protein
MRAKAKRKGGADALVLPEQEHIPKVEETASSAGTLVTAAFDNSENSSIDVILAPTSHAILEDGVEQSLSQQKLLQQSSQPQQRQLQQPQQQQLQRLEQQALQQQNLQQVNAVKVKEHQDQVERPLQHEKERKAGTVDEKYQVQQRQLEKRKEIKSEKELKHGHETNEFQLTLLGKPESEQKQEHAQKQQRGVRELVLPSSFSKLDQRIAMLRQKSMSRAAHKASNISDNQLATEQPPLSNEPVKLEKVPSSHQPVPAPVRSKDLPQWQEKQQIQQSILQLAQPKPAPCAVVCVGPTEHRSSINGIQGIVASSSTSSSPTLSSTIASSEATTSSASSSPTISKRMAKSPALPAPVVWERVFDTGTQLYFYYNTINQQSQWTIPEQPCVIMDVSEEEDETPAALVDSFSAENDDRLTEDSIANGHSAKAHTDSAATVEEKEYPSCEMMQSVPSRTTAPSGDMVAVSASMENIKHDPSISSDTTSDSDLTDSSEDLKDTGAFFSFLNSARPTWSVGSTSSRVSNPPIKNDSSNSTIEHVSWLNTNGQK